MTRVLALDLSLNSTGWATSQATYGTIDPHGLRGPTRLSWVRDQVLELEHDENVGLVAIEGYAYGRANQAHQVGELGGVIRCALHDADIDYIEVSPSTIKRYATGKGNANKNAMLVSAGRRLGYTGDSNDEADALWLHAAVSDALGLPWVDVPASHREALKPVLADLEGLWGADAA